MLLFTHFKLQVLIVLSQECHYLEIKMGVVFANPRPEEPFGKNDQTYKMTTIFFTQKHFA